MQKLANYGSWPSSIKAELLAQSVLRLSECVYHQDRIYWLESRPVEQGRVCLMEYHQGAYREVLRQQDNVRTRVHEYGGGAYTLGKKSVYFTQFNDQAVYRLPIDGEADCQRISPKGPYRFADLHWLRDGVIVAVCEEHIGKDVKNYLVLLQADPQDMNILFDRTDFVSSPSYCGPTGQLAWIAWDHPNMPWDKTSLYTANLHGHELNEIECLHQDQALLEPKWGPDNRLYVISDDSNWWNLYVSQEGEMTAVIRINQEMSSAPWVFANGHYDFLSDGRIVYAHNNLGKWQMSVYAPATNTTVSLPLPYNSLSYVCCHGQSCLFVGASSHLSSALLSYNLARAETHIIQKASSNLLDEKEISVAQSMTFNSNDPCYGFFYAPYNSQYGAAEQDKPPLLVFCHGGPTAAANAALDVGIQFWTNRGFAVLSMNYRGSTGYGRSYRQGLRENWGVYDVEDCVKAVEELLRKGLVDEQRIGISGGSAGGYTVLCALCFSQIFKAGCCRYGIGDLESLLRETHKFESHYLYGLVGAYPQQQQRYRQRSPIHAAHKITSPVLFLHGKEDAVVPINQAEHMLAALKSNNIPCKLVSFENEQHGFRRAENIIAAMEIELAFFVRVFALSTQTEHSIALD